MNSYSGEAGAGMPGQAGGGAPGPARRRARTIGHSNVPGTQEHQGRGRGALRPPMITEWWGADTGRAGRRTSIVLPGKDSNLR